jgi:membrane fusion protein, multidrug efflux system
MRRVTLIIILAGLAACGGTQSSGPEPIEAAVVVGRESTTTVRVDEILTGPLVSGTLQAKRQATIRAEIGGSVLEVHGEEGQPVRQGQLLARIEAAALQDMVVSAQSAVRSAENALQMARSEETRTARLIEAGALAERNLETAQNAVASAQAALADARARLVSAEQQLGKTTIRAPISGVLTGEAANAGDVVTQGTTLFQVIDPSRLELQASVPAEELPNLRVGTPVDFEIRGSAGQQFTGRIERISPSADPVTRQVSVFVAVPNSDRRLVSGLFAQGRVATQRRRGLIVPKSAVQVEDVRPWVLKVTEGKTERVEVQLGVEDRRTERVEVLSGVTEGDLLLLGAAQHLTPGTSVEVGPGTDRGREPGGSAAEQGLAAR